MGMNMRNDDSYFIRIKDVLVIKLYVTAQRLTRGFYIKKDLAYIYMLFSSSNYSNVVIFEFHYAKYCHFNTCFTVTLSFIGFKPTKKKSCC